MTARWRDRLRLLPPEHPQPFWRRVALGMALGVLSVLLRLPFEPVLAGSLPFVFFLPAVTVAAVRGGVAAATAAVAVSLLYLSIASPYLHRFSLAFGLPFALFLLASGLVMLTGSELRGALARLRTREAELQASAGTLERSETLRRAILASATDFAIISLDRDGRVTSWNAGAARILGWSEAEMLGRPAHIFFTPQEIADGVPEEEMRQAAATGRGEDERFHLRKDGSRFWANGLMMPLRTSDSSDIGFIKILRDRTAQHAAEKALRESEARLQLERATLEAIFEAAPVGLSLAEAPDGRAILVNEEARRMTGRDLVGPDVQRYASAGARHADGRLYAVEDYPTVRALKTGEVVRAEPTILQRPDGSAVRTEISSTPLRDGEGAIAAAITVVVDVEAREVAIERQRLLLDELAHRMKNTLSMVQAIVSQTLRTSGSAEAARGEIMERLAVLSRAQDVLTRTSWVSAELQDVVRTALAPQSLGSERLVVEGPQVRVGSRAALSFTLALHELATNAVKYGALSQPGGRLEVRWSLEGDPPQLVLVWRERNGPPVQAPSRRGFGSRLIETLGRTFGGESAISYDPAGVSWRVRADVKSLAEF